MVEEVAVPLDVRLRFGRAAVQVVADRLGVDVLHIKGDAVDPSLRAMQTGTDVDILVRPADVSRLDRAIRREGWVPYSTFTYGSPFGHAQTYLHDTWGYLDLHRAFPGIRLDPASAFDLLGVESGSMDEVGVACRVPGTDAQAVLLLLNAAREGGTRRADVTNLWERASPDDRERRLRLADQLGARVALAAATGDLDSYRDRPEYALWKAITEGGSRSAEWWGRMRAATSPSEVFGLIARVARVNTEHLRIELGREPSREEVVREFLRRPRRAVAELWAWANRART
ncbi:nucleotidyltransferase family protein [Microbacterium sp. P5_E9]